MTLSDKEIEEQRKMHDDISLRFILSNKQGRRWMWKHLGDCGLTLNSFAGEQPITMAFNNGRQSVAQSLLADINRVRPGAFAQMLNEAQLEEEIYHGNGSTSINDPSGLDGITGGGSDNGSSINDDPLESVL